MRRLNKRTAAAAVRALLLVALLSTACRGQEWEPQDLRALADELIPRLEVLSGLEAREPVRLARQSRNAMRAYVTRQLDEELPPDELAGLRAAYVAFGLIPDTLDLRSLLLDLYTEQVVGYYDPESRALYLVEGSDAAELRPILAHELVHALQDQHADLEALTSRDRGNDRQTAAQAAIEGHATLVMFLLMLEEQAGQAMPVDQLPDLRAQLAPLLEMQNDQFPVFRSAPRVIRETLLFPYVAGASFVQQLWRAAPRQPNAAGDRAPLAAPIGPFLPASTEQVLDPVDRFFGNRDAPTELVLSVGEGEGAGEGVRGGRVVYENTLGQLETSILLREHLGPEAEPLAEGWDGDRYRVIELTGGETALVWYSVWDTPTAADAFADAYRRILEVRPGRRGEVERLEVQGRPAVRIVDVGDGVDPAAVPVPGVEAVREDVAGG